MLQDLTAETMRKAAELTLQLRKGGLNKAVDLATGLTGYNLEAPAKLLVNLLSPFRQTIARRTVGGDGTNWKAITNLAAGGALKAAEGTKAAGHTITLTSKSASFGSYGQLGSVTWEADIAGRNFEDARAREENLMLLLMLQREEACILGGSVAAMGAGPTPSVTASASGGALADATYYVKIVALNGLGTIMASRIARPTPGTNNYNFTSVPTLNLADGHGLLSSQGSATVSAGGGAGSITITWTPTATAAGYAIYIGTATNTTKLQGIVGNIGKIVVTAINTTGAAEGDVTTAGDLTDDSPFAGIQAQLAAAGSGAYVKNVAGVLSAAVGRGIPEIEEMLDDIYDRTKTEPDRLVMGWTEHQTIDDKLASVSNDRVKLNISLDANTDPGPVLPRFTTYKSGRGKSIRMEENPNVAGGLILALIDEVRIPNSQVPAAWQMHMGQDIMRLDYAMTAPKEEFEVRARGALAGYAPAFQGLMYGIREAA